MATNKLACSILLTISELLCLSYMIPYFNSNHMREFSGDSKTLEGDIILDQFANVFHCQHFSLCGITIVMVNQLSLSIVLFTIVV